VIASWKEFFTAVEQMRERQKVYFLARSPAALRDAKKCEEAVDECIKEKRAEWAHKIQPELLQGGT
jgi:pyrroloquinoline quinone (PQQ) biosynthesis protein C